MHLCCRPPRGGRGLKYPYFNVDPGTMRSPPSRGAWIEMAAPRCRWGRGKSPPSRGAWIEMHKVNIRDSTVLSPPSRGAWIEILLTNGGVLGSSRRKSRPPRGGRGLKSNTSSSLTRNLRRPPRGGRGLKCETAQGRSLHKKRRPPRGGRGLKFWAKRLCGS